MSQHWCDPHGDRLGRGARGIVGEIFFDVDLDVLNGTAPQELQKLSRLSMVTLGHPLMIMCVGHADHRASCNYNSDLGKRRANRVKSALEGILASSRNLTIQADSLGEKKALQPSDTRPNLPSEYEMAFDRKVVIYSNYILGHGPIRLDPVQIFGRLPPRIRFVEVNPSAPNWSIPARPHAPATTPGEAFGRAADGIARHANSGAVQHRINEEIEAIRPTIAYDMINHARGGILVVMVCHTQTVGAQGTMFGHSEIQPGVFANPRDAISVFQSRRRAEDHLDASSSDPYVERSFRYYWATRQ
jgi:hypothetical protein